MILPSTIAWTQAAAVAERQGHFCRRAGRQSAQSTGDKKANTYTCSMWAHMWHALSVCVCVWVCVCVVCMYVCICELTLCLLRNSCECAYVLFVLFMTAYVVEACVQMFVNTICCGCPRCRNIEKHMKTMKTFENRSENRCRTNENLKTFLFRNIKIILSSFE